MKVLLIRNNEISIEFIEEHLARNGADGEVIVAMPEDLALEIAGSIDFDLVVCGVEGYLKDVVEDFLYKVKQISKGSYSIAVLRRETLKEMGPVFFNNIDDFITSPVDSDEFALRLMKAISSAKNRYSNETGSVASEFGRIHDVSSPSSKLFDDDLPDVSIREVVDEEDVSSSEYEDPCRQESTDAQTAEEDTNNISYDEMSYDELLRQRELMLEREAESKALEEDLIKNSDSTEPEAMAAEAVELESIHDDLSYDELLRQRELMLEREAESKALEEDHIINSDSEETEAMEAEVTEPEMIHDEMSYDELLRQREQMLEREAESKALEEEFITNTVSEDTEAMEAEVTGPEMILDGLSYDELLRQREQMLEREKEVSLEDKEMELVPIFELTKTETDSVDMQELNIPSEEASIPVDLISVDNIEDMSVIQEVKIEEPKAEPAKESKPEVRSVKEEKLQEEIDLLKHLRKDYGAKTSKVEKIGLKKEKKQKKAVAEKEKTASKSGRGIFTLIARVMAFMLVLIAGTTAYFYAASNIGDGVPAIAGYKLTAVRTIAMEPTLRLGDLVISVDASVEDINENDIITFKAGDSQGTIECHRVVRVEVSAEGKILLITQGDGMAAEDEVPVVEDMIVGKVTRYIPFVGFIVNVDTLRFALASVK
ncbi:signal peptidase I [Youngiibacter multivorans]|uniref:Signal peptidase I n=1 Tax=Youngiibacter multivorans TaxID=937251 RepID=A0ABS4G7P1_9CLOT|nr:signal peptidase I [Youngiibacter multivorans]MBP1920556.1 signal peptidase I [Youngiibacter multivorans]